VGFKPKKKIYELKFEGDPDLDGLVVKLRGLNTGQTLGIETAREDGSEDAVNGMLRTYADRLVEWNIEGDNGETLPLTLDSILGLEPDLNNKVIRAWTDAINGVPAPLDSASPDGVPSLEASIPMDVPSESLAS
jgi:hypothetical protein